MIVKQIKRAVPVQAIVVVVVFIPKSSLERRLSGLHIGCHIKQFLQTAKECSE